MPRIPLLSSILSDAPTVSSTSQPSSRPFFSRLVADFPDLLDPDFTSKKMVSEAQINTLVQIEAIGASISLISVVLIVISYGWRKKLRTLPNTFILFASIANVGASVGCLIGRHGIDDLKRLQMLHGDHAKSSLCTTQAFLLEMFMQSDAWWSFAMAMNVLLVFFYRVNPTSFKRWLWLYCIICFGGPAVAATSCACIMWQGRKGPVPVYGDATLWCWIRIEANVMRLYTYYLPIWTCIIGSIFIYIAVGVRVFRQRNLLKSIPQTPREKSMDSPVGRAARSNSASDCWVTRVTEVNVTSHTAAVDLYNSFMFPRPLSKDTKMRRAHGKGIGGDEERWNLGPEAPCVGPSHTVSVSATQNYTHNNARPSSYVDVHNNHVDADSSTISREDSETVSKTNERIELQREAQKKQHVRYDVKRRKSEAPEGFGTFRSICDRILGRFRHIDPVKKAYLRTSFVYAVSVLVTWSPSSILRVQNLITPQSFSYPLTVAVAVVLPLQGAWNAIIYFSTSWNLLQEEIKDIKWEWGAMRQRIKPQSKSIEGASRFGPISLRDTQLIGDMAQGDFDSTSEVELSKVGACFGDRCTSQASRNMTTSF